ncbi:hypothetical protein QBC47DRAFT_426632 [Echria macrotheca]|uniref:Uncharacterized protein n=1 Tax=Echria macrotheca TaxID=438768 RepID=A0AAJ0B101_9PEZI|nr:hypothetical protein QBC47DRAFT_426632 [Echria macrotheca]
MLAAITQPRWVPWVALLSLVVILFCASAAVGIVVGSNNQTVDSWAIQPAVLLAILSSILNIAFVSALSPGLAVRFWLRASKGTTLAQLHHIWNARGLGIFGALRAGSESQKVAVISAFIYIIQFANGPLLQRSTYQVGRASSTTLLLSLDLAPNIPEGTLNTIGDGTPETMDAHRKWIMVEQEWWQNTTMETRDADGYVCNGTCLGNVPGVGITHSCTTSTTYLDYTVPEADNKTIFSIASHLAANETGGAYLFLNTSYVSDISESCLATIIVENCNITAGLVEYPIVIKDKTISLRRSELLNMKVRETYSMPGDSPTAPNNTPGGPLAALEKFIWSKLEDDAVSRRRNDTGRADTGRTYSSPGLLADIFFVADQQSYSTHVLAQCGLKWASPTEYVLLSLHDFIFRAALHAGEDTKATQTFEAHREGFELIFRSNEGYLAAAAVSVGVAVATLVALIWGWWWLEFPVDFSPLGIAKAFGAPILRDTKSKPVSDTLLRASAEDIEAADGQVRVVVVETGKS